MSDISRSGHRPCDPDAARLRVRDLTVRVDGTVLLDVRDLDLHPGVTALTGANGAGKSTLLKALATLVPAGGGTIALGGTSTATRKARPPTGTGSAICPKPSTSPDTSPSGRRWPTPRGCGAFRRGGGPRPSGGPSPT